ncbi:MAG: hypothetical protein EOO85_10650 [Pedobacter sp.]|nr:MAG: hypothetical protein EOO85_10650 [Pedobacter sp.]
MKGRLPIIPLIYSPWLLSMSFSHNPILSFLTAWLGSFLIFYITIASPISPYSKKLKDYIMRPLVLQQLIFAGFMCCTSIFYFIEHIGDDLTSVAKCQRLSLLGHASLATGILLSIKRRNAIQYIAAVTDIKLQLILCFSSLLISILLNYIPALLQFKYPLVVVSIISGALLLTKGIKKGEILLIISGSAVFFSTLTSILFTGFKEAILVQFIILSFNTFPYYKKTTLFLAIPIIYLLLYVLPTYTSIIRLQSWGNGKSEDIVVENASQTFFNEANDQLVLDNNWKFLTNRFSEIGMFVKYVDHVPDFQDYYGLEILQNSFSALIPRALWQNKPITEKVAMNRVYDSGIAQRSSVVSAKTRPVVDGYLIAGTCGVFALMFIYGILTQRICNKAEQWFGGYETGCIIIFNGLFQQLWRGNTLEFLLNNIVYAFLLMKIIHWTLIATNLLKRAN